MGGRIGSLPPAKRATALAQREANAALQPIGIQAATSWVQGREEFVLGRQLQSLVRDTS
jgi:hypothetical protein